MGKCQNVVCAVGLAGVAELGELSKEDTLVLVSVHFADNTRTFFFQQTVRPVLADVRGFTPKELEVDLEPKRVTIIGRHQTQTTQKTAGSHYSEMRATRLLRSLQSPVKIDTKHATVRLERGVLELDVRKALAGKGNTGQAASSAKTA